MAQSTNRNRVPAEVIQIAPHELDTESEKDKSQDATSESEGSESESESEQNDQPSTLSSDAEQFERMLASYGAVGGDFPDYEDLLGAMHSKLQRLESVPQRWPLARLTIPLQRCVDHLERVLVGCCWEVLFTRAKPDESLASLRTVAKGLTMLFAIYLAKVASILRGILAHPDKTLHDDSTAHLLCSNYWVLPIYQELLHSSSRYNATGMGEKNRPCNGLARISAFPRPPKRTRPPPNSTRFADWLGSRCYADTLHIWFPAHWVPMVLQGLQNKEDGYRAAHPSWMDEEEVSDDIRKQWQEARANRIMQFTVEDYNKDSNTRMLKGTMKADWIQLPIERFLATLPILRQGVVSGVFLTKGASPWITTRAEKLQVSVFIPSTSLPMEDWHAKLCALPTVWPDVYTLGTQYLRRVVGYDFHRTRRKYEAASMWGSINPRWQLLHVNLVAKGPSWAWPPEREAKLFTNRSNRPGDDLKDDLRNNNDSAAWRMWKISQRHIKQLKQPGPPVVFPGDSDMIATLYAQVREEVQEVSLQLPGGTQDVPRSGKKGKRKQADDTTISH